MSDVDGSNLTQTSNQAFNTLSDTLDNPFSSSIYSPLRSGRIRVVHIQKGRELDTISCTLADIPRESHTPYEALSYVWGDLQNPIEIYLEGYSFRVTKNLGEVLRRL